MRVTLDIWRSQDILQESVLSSYPIDSGAQSVASRLGRKHLRLQSFHQPDIFMQVYNGFSVISLRKFHLVLAGPQKLALNS